MGGIFGGGKSARKAQKQAEAQQQRSYEMQQVANNRTLAQQQEQTENEGGPVRRPVRGRRLFAENAYEQNKDKTTLA